MTQSVAQAVSRFDIETARLRLRPLDADDEALYCALYTDAKVMRFIGAPWSQESARRNFRRTFARNTREPPTSLYLTIIEKWAGEAVGLCGISGFDPGGARAEIGAVLKSAVWGQGFAQEGLTALINVAFAAFPVDELWVQYPAGHRGAQALVEQMGFLATERADEDSGLNRTGSIYRKARCMT